MKRLPNKRILRFLASSSAALVLMLGPVAHAQENQGFVVDKIIAKIDNYIVLKSELEAAYQGYLSEGNPSSEEARCQILNQLIMNKLMVAKAEIDSVVVTDAEVDGNTESRMQMILQNSGNSPEQLERAYGKTLDQIKLELRDQIREQLVAREMTNVITKDLSVTPHEIKKFFNKIPKDSLPYYSSDVEVAQLVKKVEVSERQKSEAKQRLLELRERILAGEDFGTLARNYSEDPSAQYNGGELGYFGRGAMVPQFEAMAFRLKVGELSQPFESSFGFHIMQLLDRRGNEYNSRHILISATPSEADIERTTKYVDSLRAAIAGGKLKFEQAVKDFSDDQATKGRGGFFTDDDGSQRVSVRELDPVVYLAIDTMQVGNVSRPLAYRMPPPDNKDAVRIFYFRAKLPPHEANLKDDWSRIQSAALAEKKDRALNRWFNKARTDVFISIDPAYNGCGILEQ